MAILVTVVQRINKFRYLTNFAFFFFFLILINLMDVTKCPIDTYALECHQSGECCNDVDIDKKKTNGTTILERGLPICGLRPNHVCRYRRLLGNKGLISRTESKCGSIVSLFAYDILWCLLSKELFALY
jgi:hypothetical protein